jgi:phosphatidylinositol glycan class B
VNRTAYKDESDVFYVDPNLFIGTYFQNNKTSKEVSVPGQNYKIMVYEWPSHIVLFDNLKPALDEALGQNNYKECLRFFNSHWHDDERRRGDVLVYCKS